MPMNFAPPYQPMDFGQGNPLFGGQMPPQGMPQQGMPQGMPPSPSQQMGLNPGPIGPQSPSQQMGLNPGPVGPQDPAQMQSPGMPQMRQSGGMFAEGGVGRGIAGSIGDYLLQMAHAQPIFAPMQRYKQQAALEQQMYEARQQSELQRNMAMYQFQMQNPNDENSIMARQAGYTPGTPGYQGLMAAGLQSRFNPQVGYQVDDGMGGHTMQWRPTNPNMVLPPPDWNGTDPLPQSGGGGITPLAPVGKLKPYAQGGPTQLGSATFHY